MAPITSQSTEENHQELIDQLDIHSIRKPFRNPAWKPAQRRNKNIKQIIGEATRKEASLLATQNNSGISTPVVTTSPGPSTIASEPSISQAAQIAQNGANRAPTVTYSNIESAPSLHPTSQRRYCDITGLPAPYTDPKTRLRYHNGEIFGVIRSMREGAPELYLGARGAQTILK